MTGHMSIMGEAGRPPVIMGIPVADLLAGVFAAIAVLAGVEGTRARGRGDHFDVAMFDVMVEMLAHVGTLFLNTGQDQEPRGSAHPFITPWQAFRCADDAYIVVAPREEHFWTKLRGALGDPEELARPEFDEARSRQDHRDELLPLLEGIFARRDSREWLQTLQGAGVPAAPVNRMPEVFDDPHVEARGMIRSFSLGDVPVRAVGNAIKVVGTEEAPAVAPPALGSDTEAVLRTVLGYDEGRIERLRAAGVFGEAVSA
jgi:crotonobetainyl-CoA:carnitine CoA-transferase CaiB-like acyl-CoA transferase